MRVTLAKLISIVLYADLASSKKAEFGVNIGEDIDVVIKIEVIIVVLVG
jgi:hypothetical protein